MGELVGFAPWLFAIKALAIAFEGAIFVSATVFQSSVLNAEFVDNQWNSKGDS
jgi:hypothetical protein